MVARRQSIAFMTAMVSREARPVVAADGSGRLFQGPLGAGSVR
jgi:hypothetical protein